LWPPIVSLTTIPVSLSLPQVNQTGDLASLSFLSPDQLAVLPSLLHLRDALYSPDFLSFLRGVTGCGPLSSTKRDMSVNSYTKNCHLLNHDDVIGTRRVSWILYMPIAGIDSSSSNDNEATRIRGWQKEWGGALELYPVKTADGSLGGEGEPECIPEKVVPPSWGQFVFFEVQPGMSFHSVEEVVVGDMSQGDARARLSISGWFHAAQKGEEGYMADEGEKFKSSLEQLVCSLIFSISHP
jgi:prolyl 3-hydroxylase /prolyl 3,4-dihydroxylase